ncbi:YcjX family protein [Jannaschia sp. W003]|uniref:YcjX family protein n=1 Tax=Jannaschia sp. W003 TaxID=2867012 RepID=UPI0021A40B1F|nr:YcjX family protein [Jannaschia sp. W003]UWQ22658.1 YcjX family protein [Jannaschia sp. W003]
MVIGRLAETALDAAGALGHAVTDVFDPTLRLGVTGLSRAGKTVFVTSLVANLVDRGRMPGLHAGPRIEAAFLQPQPDDAVPRFDYETNLAALTGAAPHWPEGTRSISTLRLSVRSRQGGMLAGLRGARTLHVDIVDYPGEWLLDLALLPLDYEAWSARALGRLTAWGAGGYRAALETARPDAPMEEPEARRLAVAYAAALGAAREAGAFDLTPGRFLLPGEMEGSPALTFAPLPPSEAPRGSLAREFARRFEAYKSRVVRPFFREHFARIDRQVVLVDVLEALRRGPRAMEELQEAVTDILRAFNPGRTGWLLSLVGGRRIDRILFAATKADHLHHAQHARLEAILERIVRAARDRADFAGAETRTVALAALRATTEEEREVGGERVGLVRGTLEDGRAVALSPGDLPDDPARLVPGPEGRWLDGDYDVMRFRPAPHTLRRGDGPPHIRMDRAAEFLIGDRL